MYREELPLKERLTEFIYRVYGLMSFALFITAATAYYVYKTPTLAQQISGKPGLLIFLFIVQFVFVILLTIFLPRMNFVTAFVVFILYAISLGFTLSIIFTIYTATSIYSTFLVAASMFGGISLYGYVTKTDLTKVGSISLMALFGLIVGLFINMFLHNRMIDFILSAAGVIIFSLLTAYDVQKIKQLGQRLIAERQTMNKVALLGALTLYLDFINLFLYLLQLFGKRQQD